MVVEYMEVDDYIQNILIDLDSKDSNIVLQRVTEIKNVIIGNNKFKTFYLQDDIINKLVDIINKSQDNNKLIKEVLITLCSFTKGTQVHKQRLTGQHRLHETLFAYVCLIDRKKPENLKSIETCLKCLRNLYTPDTSKVLSKSLIDYLYVDLDRIQVLFELFNLSDTCKESIIDLFSNTCYFREYQDLLVDLHAMQLFSCLLMSHSLSTQLSILNFFACITYNNKEACNIVMMDETNICDPIATYLSREKPVEIQLHAAKCFANLFRMDTIPHSNSLIRVRTLSTIIRLCQRSMPLHILIQSLSTFTYLIELSADLQETASYLEQIVPTLSSNVLIYSSYTDKIETSKPIAKSLENGFNLITYHYLNENINSSSSIKLAAISFHALAGLAANNEEVRRRISDQDGLMNCLIEAIQEKNENNLRLGALSLLHSLSRSVQQLRTKFLDHKVWTPVVQLTQSDDDNLVCITTAILSNLLLEFSPTKETMIEYGVINMLVKLIEHTNVSIKINCMWALMNMAFQADQKIKQQILSTITIDKLFQLLTEQNENLTMKTLGLLRNLICHKPHIDQIMHVYGTKVIQAVVMILEGDYSVAIKEQALCILSNVADGNESKDYIMGNEDLLRKINSFMVAAVFCTSNLVWNTEDGAAERQTKLKEMGVQRILQRLLHTTDPILFDKVKNSLQQFL